jgi:hypothetical protein
MRNFLFKLAPVGERHSVHQCIIPTWCRPLSSSSVTDGTLGVVGSHPKHSLLHRLQQLDQGMTGGFNPTSVLKKPFFLIGQMTGQSHNATFKPAESGSGGTSQYLPKWRVRLIHPDMAGTNLLSGNYSKKESDTFWKNKLVVGGRAKAVFTIHKGVFGVITKVRHYTPEQIKKDHQTSKAPLSIFNWIRSRLAGSSQFHKNFLGYQQPLPLEPIHYDFQFDSPYRSWDKNDPKLTRKNIPSSQIVGGAPSLDIGIYTTLRDVETFVHVAWPTIIQDLKVIVNGNPNWKQPEGMRRIFATEVFGDQNATLSFVIDGEDVPCIILPERNTIMDDLLSGFEMKYWWL